MEETYIFKTIEDYFYSRYKSMGELKVRENIKDFFYWMIKNVKNITRLKYQL